MVVLHSLWIFLVLEEAEATKEDDWGKPIQRSLLTWGSPSKPLDHSCPSMLSYFPRVGKGILASLVTLQVFRIHVSCAH